MTAPSVGRVVHYVARGSLDGAFPPVCRAALITEVVPQETQVRNGGGAVVARYPSAPPLVGLAVLNPSGVFFHSVEMGGVEHDDGDPSSLGSEGKVGPLCDGRDHTPGSWHWPGRVEDTARAADRGAQQLGRR